jgi:hypothetical protein
MLGIGKQLSRGRSVAAGTRTCCLSCGDGRGFGLGAAGPGREAETGSGRAWSVDAATGTLIRVASTTAASAATRESAGENPTNRGRQRDADGSEEGGRWSP